MFLYGFKHNDIVNIQKSFNKFIEGQGKNKGRKPDERYASFDYCYNYFYSFYSNNKIKEISSPKNIQTSCLQIGFYLASWGMMRGSSFMLEKSVRHLKELIISISNMDKTLWEIDVPNYDDEFISKLLQCKKDIIEALGVNNKPSDTLVTKIMLGVFGNIPAFDQYFRRSLGVYTVNKKSLLKVKDFYLKNKSDFDSFKIFTLDFETGMETKTKYTIAKYIDMFGFMDGQ
jgi:hypothetical protein